MWLPSSPARSLPTLACGGGRVWQGHRVIEMALLLMIPEFYESLVYIYIIKLYENHVAVCGLYILEFSTIGICLVDIA